MKIKTEITTLDGTPEELAEYQKRLAMPLLEKTNLPNVASGLFLANDEGRKGHQFVSLDVARQFLARRPLSIEQRNVLVALYKAHPNKVPGSELQRVVNYTARQLAGLMGAFGRRLSHTPGYQTHEQLFDWEKVDEGWKYGLPDSVRRALEIEKIV